MPYISQKERDWIDGQELAHYTHLETAGQLNYVFSSIISSYLGHQFNYQKINDVIGALEGTKLEFYRRVAVPYEEQKMKDNGDVYDV